MLLRFTAKNFLSLKGTAELSLVASSLKEQSECTIPTRYAKYGVVPVVVIYGANASGKSNVLGALELLRSMVLRSFTQGEEGRALPYKPFALDGEGAKAPTEFVLDFVLEDVRYQFGVQYDKERVIEEWLLAFPKAVQQTLYARVFRDGAEEYHFSRQLSGSNKQIQSITRPDSLFISVAAKSNHALLTKISDYFRTKISCVAVSASSNPLGVADVLHGNDALTNRVLEYLKEADTGIADVKIEDYVVPDEFKSDLDDILKALKKFSGNVKFSEKNKKLSLGHLTGDGNIVFLDYADESMGTHYLMSLLPHMLKTLDAGGTLVLDEITTGLHTLLAQKLVGIFMSRDTNPHGAQLVFSTHDTNLLSPGVLRRDSIWLTEKSAGGVTTVYPLTDIKTKNTDNIERGYIQGRFGAIPVLPERTEPLT
ncbi:AAA family ATPase [Xenophilus azovorans]|uniref:AAA family ATPase n=1 Tax=Xenophilus azovorans TaxID=151755 RepID=UPI000A06A5FE|nr:ATP-binding protein [Xenophilus azovorans]